jgi:hypothetical protein
MSDLHLKNLFNYLISEGHVKEANSISMLRKEAIEWPWETWNNLPEKPKSELMDFLDTFSWLPVIGVGGDSAKFVLYLFSEDYVNAARSLIMIVINFVLQVKMASKIIGYEAAFLEEVSIFSKDQFINWLKKEMHGEIIGFAINLIDSQLNNIGVALSRCTTSMMVGLSRELNSSKNNVNDLIKKETTNWMLSLSPASYNSTLLPPSGSKPVGLE